MSEFVKGSLFPLIADKILVFQNKLYCNPEDIKNNDIIYCDTHEINKFKNILIKLKNLTIITHNSDGFLIEKNQNVQLTPRQKNNFSLFSVEIDNFLGCFKRWYGLNVYTQNKNICPIPIGMPSKIYIKNNNFERTEQDFINLASIETIPKKNIYLNLTKETNLKERQECYNEFPRSKENTIEISKPFNMALNHRDYLMKIKNHRFVISPPGGQLDCYRTWETLVMKRIPILKNVGRLKELYKNIPSIFVDDWSELKRLDLSIKFDFSYQPYLYFDFWSNRIKCGEKW